MLVAILSDIHDQVWNLEAALPAVAHCDALICCGDLCSPFIVDQLARGFAGPLHIVFGNNDADLYRITGKAPAYPHLRLRGEFLEEEFAGRRVAAQHFGQIALPIARAGLHDAVFFGHDHVARVETFGRTIAVNPGSIMGCQFDARANRTSVAPTYAIYDTATNTAELRELARG